MINNTTLSKRYYNISELLVFGFSYYQIKCLVDNGKLIKLNKFLYENIDYNGDANDFVTVCAFVPHGVICMLTAARFYNLTSYIPDSIDVAIERKMKISSFPDIPNIKVWYFNSKRYEEEVDEVNDNGLFKIYSLEKVVVDIVKYRNKIGIEETREVLKNYLNRNDRNLVKLHTLAKDLGCLKVLNTYLEVLI